MKIWNSLKGWLPFVSAAAVAICVWASLKDYVPPVYEILQPETVQAAEEGNEKPVFERPETETETVEIGQGNFDLEDGVYEGQATGYKGIVKVAVEIKNHSIVGIEIVSHEDDAAYFNQAKGVISRILESQSFDVDVVSGASYSSRGIMKAVRNAVTGEVDDSEPEGTDVGVGEGDTSVAAVEEASGYKDGVYYGSATGFSGMIKVKVTVENNKIANIELVSSGDDASYFNKAWRLVNSIISGQTTNVDTVSGATYSSVGIIKAVRAALKNAVLDGTTAETATETETETETPAQAGTLPYPDGIYEGTAEGYLGDVTMAVTIKDKTMTDIKVVSHVDDPAFFDRAKALIKRMLKQQNTDVDVVSGATYSSRGIIGAVDQALEKAKMAAEGKTEEEVPVEGLLPYPNGFYYGSAAGCKGPVKVAVVIRDKTMRAVVLTDSADDAAQTEKARLGVIPKIILKQNAKVDTVSGATETSRAIMDAVEDALRSAKEAADRKTDEQDDETPAPGDGVYAVSVVCEPDEDEDFDAYNLSMNVTVSHGKITGISDIVQDGDPANDSYIKRAVNGTSSAVSVVDQILQNSSADSVDTVSRATCSSNAIINACRQALEQAEKAAQEEGQ